MYDLFYIIIHIFHTFPKGSEVEPVILPLFGLMRKLTYDMLILSV